MFIDLRAGVETITYYTHTRQTAWECPHAVKTSLIVAGYAVYFKSARTESRSSCNSSVVMRSRSLAYALSVNPVIIS